MQYLMFNWDLIKIVYEDLCVSQLALTFQLKEDIEILKRSTICVYCFMNTFPGSKVCIWHDNSIKLSPSPPFPSLTPLCLTLLNRLLFPKAQYVDIIFLFSLRQDYNPILDFKGNGYMHQEKLNAVLHKNIWTNWHPSSLAGAFEWRFEVWFSQRKLIYEVEEETGDEQIFLVFQFMSSFPYSLERSKVKLHSSWRI